MICLAIKHVHDSNFIYRDLNTSNIYINKNGNVKIGEF